MYTVHNFRKTEGGEAVRTWERMRKIVQDRKRQNGQTQKFIAQKCGFDEKTFSQLINGHKTVTDTDIDKFCTGMLIVPNDIFSEKYLIDEKTDQPRTG